MDKKIDCLVCGTCVVDILVRPVSLRAPIGGNRLWHVSPITTTVGGIVSNAGTALARLGQRVATFSRVGNDAWADELQRHFQAEKIDTRGLLRQDTDSTGTTAVLIDDDGERSFAHHQGAPAGLTAADIRDNFSMFAQSRIVLIGYYSLLPGLDPDLLDLLREFRRNGCLTAIETGGSGGDIHPLDDWLPYLDFYIPSLAEAAHQTGDSDPERILNRYRSLGASGIIGIKLGSRGALLSPKRGELVEVGCITPPGPICDSTGAGDAFYAGLLAGVLHGLELKQAAKLAAATAACCITGYGATAGLRNWQETARLANLN